MAALLAAVRVLDLASVLAGPFSGCQLAPPGAEVIRIEVPGNGERERTLAGDTAAHREAECNRAGVPAGRVT